MDTSPEYVKMCDKATEIQQYKRFGPTYGQEEKDYYIKCKEDVWLPRQDQLQEMIGGEPDILITKLINWMQNNQRFYKSGHIKKLYPTGSFEQLWLAYAMDRKYHKRWNGEEWVKVV